MNNFMLINSTTQIKWENSLKDSNYKNGNRRRKPGWKVVSKGENSTKRSQGIGQASGYEVLQDKFRSVDLTLNVKSH